MLPTPAPGFDEPLAMLRACHERIQRQCATLAKLAAHLRSDGLTHDARQAATDIHRYFSSAGRQHHADEEQDLFPALRTEPALAGLLDTLARDHTAMESLWQRLEPLLAAPDTIHDLDDFARLAGEFNALYRQHIARENSELLPQAEQLLSVEQQRELGARMAARRGVRV
jgi:hemerythrin-like domain-containing protein